MLDLKTTMKIDLQENSQIEGKQTGDHVDEGT